MFAAQHPDYALILIGFFLLVVFPVHELAHALTAHALGDRTPQQHGRLTLNPISHFHPIGGTMLVISVILTGMPLGFATTPVNPSRLRGRHGDAVVSAAGPLSNFGLALLVGIPTRLLAANPDVAASAPDRLWVLLGLIVYGNIALGIFNLLPVPPLDGGAVAMSLLPEPMRRRIEPNLAAYSLLLLVVVFMFGDYVIGPVAQALFTALVGY